MDFVIAFCKDDNYEINLAIKLQSFKVVNKSEVNAVNGPTVERLIMLSNILIPVLIKEEKDCEGPPDPPAGAGNPSRIHPVFIAA
ncbi:hypothetical protein CHS0354_036275 [Potamilus streckersoni]|uniref:Uncharacterized protein n=1 Tax=Potamilus streckersoni TaxID=2493646 RepID=A0AAE0W7P7_9BIVA|nr:hypothetical protein CHS0354_036275 [Potamilus streckersoni]